MGEIGYIYGYVLIFVFSIGFLFGYGYNFLIKRMLKGDEKMLTDKESLYIVLKSMASKTSGLSQTEREAINQAMNHMRNDDIDLAKAIINQIKTENNTTEDIVKFCELFITMKEVENDATA